MQEAWARLGPWKPREESLSKEGWPEVKETKNREARHDVSTRSDLHKHSGSNHGEEEEGRGRQQAQAGGVTVRSTRGWASSGSARRLWEQHYLTEGETRVGLHAGGKRC